MYLQAVVEADGIPESVAEVADFVWENFASDIRAAMGAKGFLAVPTAEVGRFEIERRCDSLPAVLAWIDSALFAGAD